MYLGLPSVLEDNDTERRFLYGKAGCFRLTPYGFEYRVLSGHFLSSEDNLRWVWNRLEDAIDAYHRGIELIPEKQIQEAINYSNQKLAAELIKTYKLY